MRKKFNVGDIIRSVDFNRELDRAARISIETQGESYFLTWLDENLGIRVNSPVKGSKILNPQFIHLSEEDLEDGHYDHVSKSELNTELKDPVGFGNYIGEYSYSLIYTHFHPPKGVMFPSWDDFRAMNRSRLVNNNISNLCHRYYFNPLYINGHFASSPDFLDFFIYQEKTRASLDFDKFLDRTIKHINKGKDLDFEDITVRIAYELCGIDRRNFGSEEEMLNFLSRTHTFRIFPSVQSVFELDGLELFRF